MGKLKKIARKAKTLMRPPNATESEFFTKNPRTQGMATDDGRILLNPSSSLSAAEKEGVLANEASRLWMRKNRRPNFSITQDQRKAFLGYSQDAQDVRETIAARVLTGDPSAGMFSREQKEYVDRVLLPGLLK